MPETYWLECLPLGSQTVSKLGGVHLMHGGTHGVLHGGKRDDFLHGGIPPVCCALPKSRGGGPSVNTRDSHSIIKPVLIIIN